MLIPNFNYVYLLKVSIVKTGAWAPQSRVENIKLASKHFSQPASRPSSSFMPIWAVFYVLCYGKRKNEKKALNAIISYLHRMHNVNKYVRTYDEKIVPNKNTKFVLLRSKKVSFGHPPRRQSSLEMSIRLNLQFLWITSRVRTTVSYRPGIFTEELILPRRILVQEILKLATNSPCS